ncbi:hypothetical protein AC1031_017727 [Aphanomyces cochlioides]|nr:hypothetical protein AC1031_017727 [Aphanomyces cochlioides]
MEVQATVVEHHPMRVLENRLPFRDYVLVLFVFYLASFAVTWYRIWWDTVLATVVTAAGVAALWFPMTKEAFFLDLFYYGSFCSVGLHVITIGFLSYDLVLSDIDKTLGIQSSLEAAHATWGYFMTLIVIVVIQSILAAVTLNYCFRLRLEIQRNSLMSAVYPGYTARPA